MNDTGRPRGLSLIEVLIAFGVMAVGLYTVMSIFPTGFAAAQRSKHRLVALGLAQQKLEEITTAFKRNTVYCDSRDATCCSVLVQVYGTCAPTTREVAFPAPYARYYFRVNAASTAAPQPQRAIDLSDSWWSTWDSTASMVEVEVFGPVDSPADLPVSRSAARMVLVTLVARDVAPFGGGGARFDPADPHAQGIPRYRVPVQLHLLGSGATLTNPQHPAVQGD